MKRIAILATALLATAAEAAELRVYGTAATIEFRLWALDGTPSTGQTDGGTDVTVDLACDGMSTAASTNDYAEIGGGVYAVDLEAAELTSPIICLSIDATVDESVIIETYGHASARHSTVGWLTGDAFARLGAPVGASVSADLQVVDGNVDDIETAVGALPASVRDLVIEDQGGGVSLGCALAVALAYAAGDLVTTDGDSTYEDPSGTETRITGTVTSSGNRTAAITCPSY